MLNNATLRCQIFAANTCRLAVLEQEILSLHRLHPKSLSRAQVKSRRCITTRIDASTSQDDQTVDAVAPLASSKVAFEPDQSTQSSPEDDSNSSDAKPRKRYGKHGLKKGMSFSHFRRKQSGTQVQAGAEESLPMRSLGKVMHNSIQCSQFQFSNRPVSQLVVENATAKSDASYDSTLPPSPVEIHAERPPWTPNTKYVKSNLGPLTNNPWAIMLASSLRTDNATASRFPGRLLMDFSEIENPNDKQTYLLPDDIADLSKFNLKLQSSKKLKPHSSQPDKPLVRLLPYKPLLDDVGKSVRKWDDPKQAWTTKSYLLSGRLYSYEMLAAAETSEGYTKASREYWALKKKDGELDNDKMKPPTMRSDLSETQWDHNISQRLIDIMRQRVLLALKKVVQKDNRPETNLQNTFIVDLPIRATDLSSLIPELSQLYQTTLWNDMGDIEASGAISEVGARQGSATDSRPPIAVQPDEFQHDPEAQHISSDPRKWLAGSFILHTGPAESIQYAIQTPSSGATSKYIPPLMSVAGRHRLPIYNLQAMLGPIFTPYFTKILHDYPRYAAISSETSGDHEFLGDRIIVVKAVASGSTRLAEELWQLWRYIGGTDCLGSEKEMSDELDFPIHISEEQANRILKKTIYTGLSESTRQHFEDLLDTAAGKTWYRRDSPDRGSMTAEAT